MVISSLIGQKLFNAYQRGFPWNLAGTAISPAKALFSLKNPYILEAVPDRFVKQLSEFEGKSLKAVCLAIDKESKTPGFLDKLIAKHNRLFKRGFNEQELKSLLKKAGYSRTSSNYDAMLHLNKLSPDIGSHYDAHGVAKISISDQLRQLNILLTKGIDPARPFCTAPLVAPKGLGAGIGTSGGHAYRDGSFIITGAKGKTLADGIKHVIVNDAYYNIIDDLQRKFPNVNFVRADKAAAYFQSCQ